MRHAPHFIVTLFTLMTATLAQANEHFGGLLPDDPKKVSKVKMVISAEEKSQKSRRKIERLRGALTTSTVTNKRKASDRTPPAVTIVSPIYGASVSSTILIQVSSSDNVGVSSLKLMLDGTQIGTGSSSTLNVSWNPNSVSAGQHTLAAVARDAAGNSTTTSIMISVNSPSLDTTPPQAEFIQPLQADTITQNIQIQTKASDNVSVTRSQLFLDNTLLTSSSSGEIRYDFNPNSTNNGTHVLKVVAFDAAGNSSSASITIGVQVEIVVVNPGELSSTVSLITPPPANQGAEGSCVAFAVGYGARSIEQYYKTASSSYQYIQNVFSPEHLYNQIKFSSDCYSGSAMQTGLEYVKANGILPWASMPYSASNGCSLGPTPEQTIEAAKYKINSFLKMLSTDHVAIKAAISNKHPVIISVLADNSFINAGPGFIWSKYSGSGSMGHALLIVGYDDSKRAYKVMNSWGTNWGDAGFSWIQYDFFTTRTGTYVYAIEN